MSDTDTPQTTVQLLHDLGELHTRTLVSPLPKQPATLGWQAIAGAQAAGFARTLHALHQINPGKAQEITDWFQGPFEDEGPDPEEHTDWLERVIAGGDLDLVEKWVEDGRRLAEASRQATEEREAAEMDRLREERDEARQQCTEQEQQHAFAMEEARGRLAQADKAYAQLLTDRNRLREELAATQARLDAMRDSAKQLLHQNNATVPSATVEA